MAQLDIEAERPSSLEPHVIRIRGGYQSDPGDLDAGVDWRTASWGPETFRFVPVAPWGTVSRVIANVGVNDDGNLTITGGVDLTGFMLANCIDEDRPRLRALFDDQHRVVMRYDVAKFVLFLVEQYSGGKASTTSGTFAPLPAPTPTG